MKQYSFLNEIKININTPEETKPLLKKVFKVGKFASSALVGGLSILKIAVSNKISELIRILSYVKTREEAERILLNIGYIKDIDGTKKVVITRVNYALSKSVVGPSLQIVRNETDPLWKEHLLQHLSLCKKTNFIAGMIGSVISSVGIFSVLNNGT